MPGEGQDGPAGAPPASFWRMPVSRPYLRAINGLVDADPAGQPLDQSDMTAKPSMNELRLRRRTEIVWLGENLFRRGLLGCQRRVSARESTQRPLEGNISRACGLGSISVRHFK